VLARKAGKEGWFGWLTMLVGKAGWQGRRARLAGKEGGQGWLARKVGKAGWQGRWARLAGKEAHQPIFNLLKFV
jgi:hypothetical protein